MKIIELLSIIKNDTQNHSSAKSLIARYKTQTQKKLVYTVNETDTLPVNFWGRWDFQGDKQLYHLKVSSIINAV